MKQKKLTITYTWWRVVEYNGHARVTDPKHIEALEEKAEAQIFASIAEGYTSGELWDRVRMTDEDGDDGIEYEGWWSLKRKY